MTANFSQRILKPFLCGSLNIWKQVSLLSTSERTLQCSGKYDIVVTGGGMVGSAMAAVLASQSCLKCSRILLLETSQKKNYNLPATPSNRVVAISPATVELLKSIEAWDFITSRRVQPVKRMQVWDECADSVITFQRPMMDSDLAYIVENDLLHEAIMQPLYQSTQGPVQVRYETKVDRFDVQPSHVTLELVGGETIEASLVIGADGYNSLLRKTMGFHTVQWDYSQRAVVAVLQFDEGTENNVAWQRFLKTGPIAMLPLSSHHSCLIWTNTTQNVKHLLNLSSDSFVDAVNDAFWSNKNKDSFSTNLNQRLENVFSSFGYGARDQIQLPPTVIDIAENSRASFPLGLSHSSKYVGKRVALVGDSAHRIHPLAGQGVNLGFGDVITLCDQLVKAQQMGTDLGDGTHLLDYESVRQRKVVPTMAAIDGLNRLYGTGWSPIVALRSLGLQTTNAIAPLKEQIMKFAMS